MNGEFNNILNNPTALISPFTANLNANGKQITNLALENLGASPGAGTAGRVWFNTATTVKQVETDDGAFIRTIPNILATSMSPGDILYAVAGSSQGGNPSWTRLPNASSSQSPIPLVSGTSGPQWGSQYKEAWALLAGVTSSATTILDGVGVSSSADAIQRLAEGLYTIPFNFTWASSNYVVSGACQNTDTGGGSRQMMIGVSSSAPPTSTLLTIDIRGNGTNLRTDATRFYIHTVGRV